MTRDEIISAVTDRYSEPPSDTDLLDEYFMACALDLAAAAAEEGEVPVGAVVVRDGKIIAADFNGRENLKDATFHAETSAIRKACSALGGWRLVGCTLYVTLEPCPMCAGAILNARVPRTVVGAKDPKYGAFGSVCDLGGLPVGHKTELKEGVLADRSAALLRAFFEPKRKKTTD